MAALTRAAERAESSRAPISPLEKEVIEFFVKIAQVVALPKSIGEIYGLLYIANSPMSMECIMDRLSLSKGATSQGLKQLRNFGAVKAVYMPGDRRDHFIAETELKKLAGGFLKEQFQPQMEGGATKISHIESLLKQMTPTEKKLYQNKVARLRGWHNRAEKLMPWVMKFLGT